ncbi:hypothetical protein GHT07_00960 [Caenimonas koreensis DSM 17982]|uniref:Uncharacterized protein n=1 Tax=Caenimonas koreensis DSM 17982 TaxID=1121255 RepID=A0A844B5L5_9BURK|nr:hypothetical protein [Caenimonas koreensis]MRD45831.1 hypothetical protein [Caenimonas koreensis DSM 17982]
MNAQTLRRFLFTHAGAIGSCAVALLIVFAGRIELGARHFFFADDWGWLYLAEFAPVTQIVSILPQQVYNDRPVGALFIKLLYRLFGLEPRAFL